MLGHLRARLDERSTYMFILGSIGSVAALPTPWNWMGGVILIIAAMVPDRPAKA